MAKVSVCTPVYNGAKYIAKAIESVLNQSFTDFEYIISDNNSTDDTVDIIQSFKDDRIVLLRRSETSPMYPNFNNCLRNATGTYVKFLLSDDFFICKDSLAHFVEVMDNNPDVGLASGIALGINATGRYFGLGGNVFERELNGHIRQYFPDEFYLTFESFEEIGNNIRNEGIPIQDNHVQGTSMANTIYRMGNDIYGQSPTHTIFRRDLIEKVGYFNEDIPSGWGTETEYWCRLLSRSDFIKIMHPLVVFRKHNASGTSQVEQNHEQVPTMGYYWKKMKTDLRDVLTTPNVFLGHVSITYYGVKCFGNQLLKNKKFEFDHLVKGFKFSPVVFVFTTLFLPLIVIMKRRYPQYF